MYADQILHFCRQFNIFIVNLSTGTTERVCLIMGAADAVRKVHTFIMEKIREKPDPNPKPEASKSNFERHRQVTVINVSSSLLHFHFSLIVHCSVSATHNRQVSISEKNKSMPIVVVLQSVHSLRKLAHAIYRDFFQL